MEHLKESLKSKLGPDFIHFDVQNEQPILWVYPAAIVRVLSLLSSDDIYLFQQLIDLTAVDYPSRLQRFDIVYNLLSLEHNQRLLVKIAVKEGTDVPSCTQIFINANWYEREVWDLFGILFNDHPDLRRILTDYNFQGHPLRKDFPLTGYTQVKYCEVEKKVIYESVQLQQEYRTFDFISPWEGAFGQHETITPSKSPSLPNLLPE